MLQMQISDTFLCERCQMSFRHRLLSTVLFLDFVQFKMTSPNSCHTLHKYDQSVWMAAVELFISYLFISPLGEII